MSRYEERGIDIYSIPGYSNETTLFDVVSHFGEQFRGKILNMHFEAHEEEIVVHSLILFANILPNANVILVTEDKLDMPVINEFDGKNTDIIGSIYEEGDFWFQEEDERIWWGIWTGPIGSDHIIKRDEPSE
jgi:hypothetical protein